MTPHEPHCPRASERDFDHREDTRDERDPEHEGEVVVVVPPTAAARKPAIHADHEPAARSCRDRD